MKHTVLMSPADSKLINGIQKQGINVIESECLSALRENEQYHADMQLLIINRTAFIPRNCTELINKIENYFDEVILCTELEAEYPRNVALNAALIGNKLFCKASALAQEVKEFCAKNNIITVNVNQGYSRCSTLIVNNNALITADKTIYDAAVLNSINALRITEGFIKLQNVDYGFIGGSSGKVGDMIF